jgi:DNA-binding SARP family transcriptional activator
VEFKVLGPIEVRNGDVALALGGGKQRAVLAHLLVRANSVVPIDTLIDELWGDDPPETARNTLQTYVYRLRKVLGDDRIQARAGGYALSASAEEVDASRFEAHLKEAKASLSSDPASSVRILADALDLWRGPALADLSQELSLKGEIARLDELRLAATEHYIAAELALGRHSTVVSELEALTVRYPHRERLWAHLMLALYRAGRPAEALDVYQRAREVLGSELGTEPSPELQSLHRQILAHDPELGLAEAAGTPAQPSTPTSELVSGTGFAGYRIERALGLGGMSVVYLATHLGLQRKVALKVIAPRLAADEDFRERFVRESRLAASIDHPNIVPIYEAGEVDGQLFIAMRYVDGTDLRGLLRGETPPSVDRVLAIADQVASALDAAHARGLVHRDVKPGNVLIARSDGPLAREHVYLSDFGLTKRLGSGTGLTRSGQFVGTVDYVAPEQIEGKPVDGSADVYSLACVLFECLTGSVPYVREAEVAALYAHLSDEPPHVTATRPDLPAAVDRVFARAMSKSPARRYRTAAEFVTAVRQALGGSGGATSGMAPSALAGGRRPRPVALLAVVAAAVALTAGVVFSLTRGGSAGTRSQAPPASASTSPSPNPTFTFPVEDRPFTPVEQRLLERIPEAMRSGCSPSEASVGPALGEIACTDQGQQVLYAKFDSAEEMNARLDQNVGGYGAPSGDCGTEHEAVGSYRVGGTTVGRVLCYQIAGSSRIEWTDETLFIYALAVRPGEGDLSLYDWWARRAGPVESIGGEARVDKDVSVTLPDVPKGPSVMNITAADVRHTPRLRFSEFSVDTWVGTWQMMFGHGTYRISRAGGSVAGGVVDQGTYDFGKGPSVVFRHESGGSSCIGGADSQPYSVSVEGDLAEWRKLGEVSGCVPGPWPANIHPFERVPSGELIADTGQIAIFQIGSEPSIVPATATDGGEPFWSPDGSKLVYSDGRNLFVTDAEGSHGRPITENDSDTLYQFDPAWSPDGTWIAFRGEHCPQFTYSCGEPDGSLALVHPDGTGATVILKRSGLEIGRPSWSPDASKLAIEIDHAIYVIAPNGSGLTRLTGRQDPVAEPSAWTPDGDRIVFWGGTATDPTGLYSITPEGKDLHLLFKAPPEVGEMVPDVSADGRWVILGSTFWSQTPLFLFDLRREQLYQVTPHRVAEASWRPTAG